MASEDKQTGEMTVQEAAPHANDVFPPFDSGTFASQLVWLAITFGFLYYVMAKVALPRIAGILEHRQDKIASDIAEAEQLKQETETAIANYEEELAKAKNKAHEIAKANRDSLNKEIIAKREKAEAKLATMLAEAETRIEETKNAALTQVDEIATDTTLELIGALLDSSVSKSEANNAVLDSKR